LSDAIERCREADAGLREDLSDMAGEWTCLTYREACQRFLGACWADHEDLAEVRRALGAQAEGLAAIPDPGTFHLKVVEVLLQRHYQAPTFLSGLPATTSPLMRRREDDPSELDR